ncbi:MAG TPA: hypothetical protein VJL81_15060 [Solirubrobacterales bacterium]|nr:hypothetical protein [Solirubrobacterales bacterium]
MKHDADIGRIRRKLQDESRRLFSKKYRLEVAALIAADDPPIWARHLARRLDIGENQAASELAEFEQLGALQRFPSDFDRRKLYVIRPHYLWAFSRQALEHAIHSLDPEDGEELLVSYWAWALDGDTPQPIPTREADRP